MKTNTTNTKTEETPKPELQEWEKQRDEAAALLIHYFQLLGARSGLMLNPNQYADIASVTRLLLDAALARVVAEAVGSALKQVDAAVELQLVKIAEAGKKGGAK